MYLLLLYNNDDVNIKMVKNIIKLKVTRKFNEFI